MSLCACGYYRWEHGGILDESQHRCPPKFYIRADDEESESEIHAPDPQEAVERWASRYDSNGDYPIVGGSEMVVHVRRWDEEEPTRFRVEGHLVPEYTAEEIS